MTEKNFPAEQCMWVMNKLLEMKISKLFDHPVDPVEDECPNYYKVIKKPMDLGTVKKKIHDKKYHTVAQWRTDVEQVWSNSLSYNKKDYLMVDITKYIRQYFRKISNDISDFPEVDWSTRLAFFEDQLHKLMQKKPETIQPRVIHPKKHTKAEEEAADKRRQIRQFNLEDIRRLNNDINLIRENDQLAEILQIITDNESSVDDTSEQIEINLNDLRPVTLHKIRAKIDRFLMTL